MEDYLVILVLSVVTLLSAFYGYTVDQRIGQIKDELVKAKNQHIKEINEVKVELKSKSMTEQNSAHSKELEDIRLILQETANVSKNELYKPGNSKGNDRLHILLSHGKYELLITMEDFSDNNRYAFYDFFKVGDENSKYVLTLSGYMGNAGRFN
ncbi:Hypothetical predicted protein [Mytilus galloprovincialis]|uniref:Fibrinogen C-terminal domain-containing protein n=1 Tax=Mytilus galloprovincialis TaxID=29158 RepID=A0A8B6BX92_MYTGA|nr:Hypothetical predicted protein [Mytilus galloprovincialis]